MYLSSTYGHLLPLDLDFGTSDILDSASWPEPALLEVDVQPKHCLDPSMALPISDFGLPLFSQFISVYCTVANSMKST